MRLQAIDLLVHSDRLQTKVLIPIVLGDLMETRNCARLVTYADIEVAEHVEGCEILRLALDYFAVFFYRGWDFPQLEESLGRAQSLYLVERHFCETLELEMKVGEVGVLSASEENLDLARLIAASKFSGPSTLTRTNGSVNDVFRSQSLANTEYLR
jgi:hypothetical protein